MRRAIPVIFFLLASISFVPARAVIEVFPALLEQPIFWSGTGSASYKLDVQEDSWRLRIAIDHATDGDVFTVRLTDPDGRATTFSPGSGLYSAERIVQYPLQGRWTVQVTADGVHDPRFRMRAKLEAQPLPPAEVVPVLPNLQALPPYELSFMIPVTNGSTGGAPVGASLPGGRVSCHPEEVIEESAVRCLRMTFGVRNTGQGPMQLHPPGGVLMDRPLIQRVRNSDGTWFDRDAGIARYHKTHQHYHHDQAIGLQLLAVGEGNVLTPAGAEHRKGFAHRDELLREWTRFYPTWPSFGFGLAAGWGDYYEWDRPGNYIDFGVNGDGLYVLRMTADPIDGILESNEQDNVSYTLLRVTGEAVETIETGRGSDPWDPCKIRMPIGAEPDEGLSAGERPASCPPDTV